MTLVHRRATDSRCRPGAGAASVPTLGSRGQGWVALQTAAIGGVVACAVLGQAWPDVVGPALRVVGFAAEAAGVVLALAGRVALGSSFSVLPRPRDRASLRRGGVYAHARHPIYGGVLLLAFGVAFQRSPVALTPAVALTAIFLLKSACEEAWLMSRYDDYSDYRIATPRRFVPWLV